MDDDTSVEYYGMHWPIEHNGRVYFEIEVKEIEYKYYPFWNAETSTFKLWRDDGDYLDFEFVDEEDKQERLDAEIEISEIHTELYPELHTTTNDSDDDSDDDFIDSVDEDESDEESDEESDDDFTLEVFDNDIDFERGLVLFEEELILLSEPRPALLRSINKMTYDIFDDVIGARATVLINNIPYGTGRLIEHENIIAMYVTWISPHLKYLYPRGSTLTVYYDYQTETFALAPIDNYRCDFVFQETHVEALRTGHEIGLSALYLDSMNGPNEIICKRLERSDMFVDMYYDGLNQQRKSAQIRVNNNTSHQEVLALLSILYIVTLIAYVSLICELHNALLTPNRITNSNRNQNQNEKLKND
jgi:hypothetical protein